MSFFPKPYGISSYSFRKNYSFLNLEIVANSNSCRNISNFSLNKLILCYRNYSREESIQGLKLSYFLIYIDSALEQCTQQKFSLLYKKIEILWQLLGLATISKFKKEQFCGKYVRKYGNSKLKLQTSRECGNFTNPCQSGKNKCKRITVYMSTFYIFFILDLLLPISYLKLPFFYLLKNSLRKIIVLQHIIKAIANFRL